MGRFCRLLFLRMFFPDLGNNPAVVFFHPINLFLELRDRFLLLRHEPILIFGMLGLQVDNLLLQLSDSLLQLQLDEFFVAAGIHPHLLQHSLVLLLQLLQLAAALLVQVTLHLFKILFGRLFELVKLLGDFLQLTSELIGCLVTTLHRVVELSLQIFDLGPQLSDCLLVVRNVLLLHPDLLAECSHLLLKVLN